MQTTTDFIYILHFQQPRYHARHYTGSTTDLLRRLDEHWTGKGSRLTQALYRDAQDWTLAALYSLKQPNPLDLSIREIEQAVKASANAPRHCPICQGPLFTKAPRGTIAMPADMVANAEAEIRETISRRIERWTTVLTFVKDEVITLDDLS